MTASLLYLADVNFKGRTKSRFDSENDSLKILCQGIDTMGANIDEEQTLDLNKELLYKEDTGSPINCTGMNPSTNLDKSTTSPDTSLSLQLSNNGRVKNKGSSAYSDASSHMITDMYQEELENGDSKTIEDYNWSWQYKHCETLRCSLDASMFARNSSLDHKLNEPQWIQFECTDCLQLEFHYQAYVMHGKNKFRYVNILSGLVDLEACQLTISSRLQKNNEATIIEVRRSRENTRKRPNPEKRHDPDVDDVFRQSSIHFISNTNFEWLSLNYRKEKAAKLSDSKRRMIILMF